MPRAVKKTTMVYSYEYASPFTHGDEPELVAVKKPTYILDSFGNLVDLGKTPKLGSGSTRNVYAIDERRVVKIPRSPEYVRYNQNEYDCWQLVQYTRFGHLFAPVLGIQPNGWLIMERAKVVEYEHDETPGSRKVIEDLRDQLHMLGVIDLGSQNMGYLPNGNLVVIDYGFSTSKDVEESLSKIHA